MSAEAPIGHVLLRVPVFLERESESWEIPKEYTYLAAGEAELVSHDIPSIWHEHLREDLIESGGIEVSQWGEAELAATTTLHEHPLPAEPPLPTLELFSFQKAAR